MSTLKTKKLIWNFELDWINLKFKLNHFSVYQYVLTKPFTAFTINIKELF